MRNRAARDDAGEGSRRAARGARGITPLATDLARARAAGIAAAEEGDAAIDPRNRTAWWIPDTPAPRAVVLFHGFTNGPRQYARFAPLLAADGDAVIVPRLPYHGFYDRMSTEIRLLRADDLAATALDAIAIGALAGRRVVVAGISVGGTLALWSATHVAIDAAVVIAPFLGMHGVPGPADALVGAALRTLPNRFLWWDPKLREKQPPMHGYPRFSTRALGASLALGDDATRTVRPTHARSVTLVSNAREPAVNNALARRRIATLRDAGIVVHDVTYQDLPNIHDTIEPEIPQARTDLMYPRLRALLDGDASPV